MPNVLSLNQPATADVTFADGEEVWLDGIARAHVVREVARRIDGERTYRIKIGMTREETVPYSRLKPERIKETYSENHRYQK